MKTVKFTKTFEGNGEDFSAFRDAQKFVQGNGFSAGSMQREDPIGLVKGKCDIAKWRNLDKYDKLELDGVIKFPDGSPRNGKAVIELFIDFKE